MDKQFSQIPANSAEKVAEQVAEFADKLGAEICVVIVRVPGMRPDVGTVMHAADPKQARRMLITTAALVAGTPDFPGGL